MYAESPFYSGAEQQLIRNFRHLSQEGRRVSLIIVSSSKGSQDFQLLSLGSQAEVRASTFVSAPGAHPVSNFIREILSFLLGMGRAILTCSGNRFETVHVSNGGHPGSAGARGFATAVSLFFPRIRLLISVNNLVVPYNSIPRILDLPSDRILAKNAFWITGSKAAKKALEDVIGAPSAHTEVLANGVPQPVCLGNHDDVLSRLRREVNGRKVALSIGHLVGRKGHAVLLESLNHLKEEGSFPADWVFVIEGEGAERGHLETKVQNYGLTEQVLLPGQIKCVAELFELCDLFVHPSVANEDLPNVISEAMSFSLPVVATYVGGVSEQVSHDVTGRLVQPSDSEALARELVDLMTNAKLRSELGMRARVSYLENFSPDVALGKYKRIYGW